MMLLIAEDKLINIKVSMVSSVTGYYKTSQKCGKRSNSITIKIDLEDEIDAQCIYWQNRSSILYVD
jgi:hypothetical protein